MSKQEERSITLYAGRAYGHKVSQYGLENGYLDYYTLSEIVGDMVLANQLIRETNYYDWDVVSGYGGPDYLDVETDEMGDTEIYQYYIISDSGAQFLTEHTDEIVFYNEKLDLYLWGITHFGTSWDYVLTDIKLRIHLQD